MHYRHRPGIGTIAVIVFAALFAFGAGCSRESGDSGLERFRIPGETTLTYWMVPPRSDFGSLDMNEHPLYAELERVTGVHVDFVHDMPTLESLQLELLRESASLPDILEWNWRESYPGGPDQAIADRIIRPIRDLVLTEAPDYFRLLERDEEISRSATTVNGTLYAFANLRIEEEARAVGGLMIRQGWLDRIGVEIPETIDQWRNMMISMREADFGTPFRGTEYPLFFPALRLSYSDPAPTLFFLEETNAFAGSWGVSHGMCRDAEGRVKYGPTEPGYRQMLTELNRWFEEGFIHPSLASPQGAGNFIEIIAKSGATIGVYGFMSFLSPIDYVTAPPPRLDNVTPLVGASLGPICGSDRAAAISASSPNASVAARWLDVAYSPWGKQLFNFGIEESSYELLRGEPRFREPILASHRSSLGNRSGALGDLAKYSRLPFGGPFEQSASALSQLRSLGAGYGEAGNPWTFAAVPSPELVFTYDPQRRSEYERIMTPVTAHMHANFVAFVTGQRPLEEFDRFVREIGELEVNDAVALIYQAEVGFFSKPVW